ncbi:MAG: hypothetical protein JWS10_298 [Cypionkella sp.]|uniref:hypothetical protein n=1 Tax=Cypionkella sp. TaxID=2811411 RepID=UPI00263162F0|nr:hypothetical protein [Cypionkella sp.]MDB5657683.1 hypothetical protein [Cypionkella sp.]
MSEVRAKLLGGLIQRSMQETTVPLEAFLERFSASQNIERQTADVALEDLRQFGLVETTPFTIALTGLARRLS